MPAVHVGHFVAGAGLPVTNRNARVAFEGYQGVAGSSEAGWVVDAEFAGENFGDVSHDPVG
jgi:hypothetical protein